MAYSREDLIEQLKAAQNLAMQRQDFDTALVLAKLINKNQVDFLLDQLEQQHMRCSCCNGLLRSEDALCGPCVKGEF